MVHLAALLVALAALGLGCESQDPSSPEGISGVILFEPAETKTTAGSAKALRFTVRVARDAAGNKVTFTVSDGSFAVDEVRLEIDGIIDVDGTAAVSWFAPAAPSESTTVFLTATVFPSATGTAIDGTANTQAVTATATITVKGAAG